MTEKKTNRKTLIALIVLLIVAVLSIAGLMYVYITTNEELADMTAKQETTAATLAATEGTLAETQTALAAMTAKQETTAATLAATEGTLAETQTALAAMTAKQETTAATLAATEGTLAETQTALADMTAKQKTTAATLAATEGTLAETQTALAAMTAKQETTAATLAATEGILAETQTALAAMTARQEATAVTLAATQGTLTETQAALATSEAALAVANEENSRLKAASQETSSTVNAIDTSDISLAGTNYAEYVVVKELEWEKYGSHHLALIVKNTSGQAKKVSAQVLFYDANGGLIGASNPEQYVCADGEEAYLSCTCDSAYFSYEYSVELSKTNVKSLNSSIEISATINPKNVIIMAKNTGSVTPDYIEYNCVLYDKMGNVVKVDWGYLDEPAPGKMTFREISSYEAFETVEIYYSAHSFGF